LCDWIPTPQAGFRHGFGWAGFPPVEVAIRCRLAASGNFDDFYQIDPDLSN
jgi:hypothetical protein